MKKNDILNIARDTSLRGAAEEVLKTEFGENFSIEFLEVDAEANTFTLEVETGFQLRDEMLEPGDLVVFDSFGNVAE